ncbi:MAG: glycoside hydrolase family 97 protein [Bacteroidetes bacterium]|nr:glycoside hydrolase family 97 protein [Bacteroidota bacterium]
MAHFPLRVTLSLCMLASFPLFGEPSMDYTVTSPDKQTLITIHVGDQITYEISHNGKPLITPSHIALEAEKGRIPAMSATVHKTATRSVHETVPRVVWQKSKTVLEHFNERTLEFSDGTRLVFRAFNEGVAYRWETRQTNRLRILSETVEINVAGAPWVYFPEEERFFSHNERLYKYEALAGISRTRFCSTPALIDTRAGTLMLVTESDLVDYPGLWLTGTGGNGLRGLFPAYVLTDSMRNDRDVEPITRAEYIADTKGSRSFPWRILALADRDADLIANELVFLLSQPSQLSDVSWIKPGKVAWDWWNANNVYGVDFKAGINTETYKYFIDFAGTHGLEYVILDEGWYKLGDLLAVDPAIDIPALVAHAQRKNVGIILWVVWKTLLDQLTPALDQFAAWGIKGIKVDFMQRDDQWMVNYYWDIAREAAKRKMLVDFHGAHKPAGLNRAYPNVLTSEGVHGLENSKWSTNVTPRHCVTLPFTRMVAGPMDFTPGAMLNLPESSFKPMFTTPASMGTRCQQLAMYVIYESPLQMLSDSPTHYLREPECMQFLSTVPAVWEHTIPLDGKVSEYILVARKSGPVWYVGAMTNETGRTLTLDLSFLGPGSFSADIWQDGLNAHRHGNDFRRSSISVTQYTRLEVPLAPGGGWVARIRP